MIHPQYRGHHKYNAYFIQNSGHGVSVIEVLKRRTSSGIQRSEPTSLAFRASVLSITPSRRPDVTILSTPTYVYASLPGIIVNATVGIVKEELLDKCGSTLQHNRSLMPANKNP